jgi:cation diffusion facilitator CzcD-associated flavoprotein CzcO
MGSQIPPKRFDIKSVAVIGAGPCGLAAAKYLVAQAAFKNIVIFEQQSEVGGVWNYSPNPPNTLHVPQVSTDCAPEPPLLLRRGDAPVFPSPMYEVLHTNIPRALMPFSDLAFPDDTLIFPSREDVQEYLVRYSRDVRHLIQFSTQVKDVRLRQVEGKDQWDVDVVRLRTGEISTATYDAVVVASGHYAVTYIPDVKGITEFHATNPGVISHSKHYRTPTPFAGKKVVVVGNAASGLDIAAQISPLCRNPLLLSVQTATSPANLEFSGAQEVPVIEEFLAAERGIRFQDGRVEKDIDAVIFATGYLYAFPFLRSLNPPLVTDGRRVHGLYKHLFRIDNPTLVFPGLPIKVVPFPFSESQAAMFSRTWANVLPLPSPEEMRAWEEEEAKRRGLKFHVFPEGGDSEYINSAHDQIAASNTPGKEPPHWGLEQVWQRQIYSQAKLAFELGGRNAKTLEELGFTYVPISE